MSHSRSVVVVAVMCGLTLPRAAFALDAFLAAKIKDSKGSICAALAPQNVGGSCVVEEDCGGVDDESAFCVPTGFSKGQRVLLVDRFETATFDVQKPIGLATSVGLNAGTIGDAQTQLKAYQIALSKLKPKQASFAPRPNFLVRNTLHAAGSEIVLNAVKPTRLLVPTAMSLAAPPAQPNPASHAVDHYKCYAVKQPRTAPAFAPVRGVSIEGPFATPTKRYDLKKPTRVCVPVVATAVAGGYVESIDDPNAALLCYQAVLAKAVPAQPKSSPVTGIFLSNRFGRERVDTTKEEELCVPSLVLPAIGCTPNTTRDCYEGPAGTEGVGLCHAGTETCGVGGTYGSCAGQVLPAAEVPGDGIDQDCDGADQPGGGGIAPSTVIVDPTVPVEVTEVEGLDGGPARPVTALTDGSGIPMHFVENELVVVTDDASEAVALAERWGGQLVRSIVPADVGLTGMAAQHLVRVAPSFASIPQLVADLHTIEEGTRNDLRVASDAGLLVLAAAAREAAMGSTVALNVVMRPQGFEDRITTENNGLGLCSAAICPGGLPPMPPTPPGFDVCVCPGISVPMSTSETFKSNAFDWSYMKVGAPQNVGVGEAWRSLSLAGLLGNKVTIAVIDSGFSNLAVDNPVDTGYLNAVNPAEPNVYPAGTVPCSGGVSCPWHGAGVVSAAMGPADDGKGAAGPAGPIAKALMLRRGTDGFSTALGLVTSFLSSARIVNMSFGERHPATMSWGAIPFNLLTAALNGAGKVVVAAAGNENADVDSEDCAPPLDTPCWEDAWWAPCENDGVFCVGALAGNATTRASYSNWGNEEVDLFGPGTVWVGGDPFDPEPHAVSGTSVAAPFVAGVAALVMAAKPSLDAAAVQQALIQTAWPADDPVRRYVNAQGAVNLALGGSPICTSPVILTTTRSHTTAPCLENVFDVTHSQTFGPFTYQWKKLVAATGALVDVPEGGRVSGSKTAHMTIDPFRPEDAGRYAVTVGNTCGSTTSSYIRVSLVDGHIERAASLVAPRAQVAMAFDRDRGRMVLFGGLTTGAFPNQSNDTYERSGSDPWQLVTNQGPPARYEAFLAFDEARGVSVLYGGSMCTQQTCGIPLTDTWEWNGTTWTEIPATGFGSATRAMIYDPVRQRVVRADQDFTFYEWSGTEWTLRPLVLDPVNGSPTRFTGTFAAMAFDRTRNVYVVKQRTDTWEIDGSGQWTLREREPFAFGLPVSPERAGMVFDSARGRTLLYSVLQLTQPATHFYEGSLWEWTGLTWVRKLTHLLPLGEHRLSMAYDGIRQRTLMTGINLGATPAIDAFEWRYFGDDPTCSMGPPL